MGHHRGDRTRCRMEGRKGRDAAIRERPSDKSLRGVSLSSEQMQRKPHTSATVFPLDSFGEARERKSVTNAFRKTICDTHLLKIFLLIMGKEEKIAFSLISAFLTVALSPTTPAC